MFIKFLIAKFLLLLIFSCVISCLLITRFVSISFLTSKEVIKDPPTFTTIILLIFEYKFVKTNLSKKKEFYFVNGYGDKYEKEFEEPLQDVIKILNNSENKKISWKHKKIDINNHGLIWLGVYNGFLNWQK